jgi:hypothetical protein
MSKKWFPFLKPSICIFLVFLIIMAGFGAFIYRSSAQVVKKWMGNQCMGIAISAAALIERDIDAYRGLVETQDTDSEYYRRLKSDMEKIRFGNKDNIAFLYTEIRISDTEMMYITDGELEGTDTFAPPGLIEPLTETRRIAYETEAPYIGDFVTVVWGTLLSAYAPISDPDTGEFLGLVGADVSIEQYYKVMRQQLYMIAGSIAILTLMTAGLSSVLIRVYNRKLKSDNDNFIQILSSMDVQLMVTEQETDRILFANEKLNDGYNIRYDPAGLPCWKVYHNRDDRCDFCKLDLLCRRPDTPILWEYFDKRLGRRFRKRESMIRWTDGRSVRLQQGVDITDLREKEGMLQRRLEQQELMTAMSQGFISEEATDELIRKAL